VNGKFVPNATGPLVRECGPDGAIADTAKPYDGRWRVEVINQQLYNVVRQLRYEITAEFEAKEPDVSSQVFLRSFPYLMLTFENDERMGRVLEAALVPEYRRQAERGIEAAYSDHLGSTFEFYLAHAVEDFLNYVLPRIIGLPDSDTVFDRFYEQFDRSLYSDECVVTIFAILDNVWDNGGRAVLPPGYALRYHDKPATGRAPDRWTRDRSIPYFEISQSAKSIGLGRSIRSAPVYFVFSHSTTLPKNKDLLEKAYTLRDEMTRKFIFSVRLLNSSAAYADYRGFRTVGHLSTHQINLMNFPEEFIEKGVSHELQEHDGHSLRRMLPKLADIPYGFFAVIDTKIEDALRRERPGADLANDPALRVAIDQLLDYFQILEAVVPAMGSEFIALYSAVLLHAINKNEDSLTAFEFIKRMHKVRNDVMHGRMNEVLDAKKNKFTPGDVAIFGDIVHALSGAYIMNGPLRDPATKLALGQTVTLTSMYPESLEEMKAMRRPQAHPATWW